MLSRIARLVRGPRRLTVTVLAVASLVAGCLAAVYVAAGRGAPAAQAGAAVPVRAVHGHRVRVRAMPSWHKSVTSWPAAGAATVAFTAAAAGSGRAGAMPSGSVRAARLPVWVGPPQAGGTAPPAAPVAAPVAAAGTGTGVVRARVSVASRRAAATLGVRGVVVSVGQAGRAARARRVHVSVSYAGFAQAYGGDYGSRLRLVELTACGLTTPGIRACRTQTPLRSANDARRDWVGADVMLPGAAAVSAASDRGSDGAGVALMAAAQPSAVVRASVVVLAVVAGPSGAAGNYGAEPLSEAGTSWVGGGSSGAYTYSYPVAVPHVPGGLTPAVGLDYDSQATSGLTSATNNDASWVGTGWNYSPGYIETDFTTCSQDALAPVTGDMCANDAMVTLTLNGVSTPLVDGSSKWVAAADGGETIRQSGNTWEVIEPNGVQYWFGLNQLPGWAAGDPTTNSVWSVPVWEGCGQAALCTVPWRVNLDYVVDPHGNAIAYFYSPQTNYYAEQDGTTGDGQYTQGGALTSIEYGLRAGQVYTSAPAAQITFTSAPGRQDAPTDLTCASGAACDVTSPTFWNDDTLTTITTQSLRNGALQNVDSYAVDTTYPATGGSSGPSLWLASVTRTGQDGATPVTLPPVNFGETPLPNRVQTPADTAAGYPDLSEPYLTSVTNDTGGVTSIAYTPPDPAPCAAGSFPAPGANTTACYPGYWDPPGATAPVQDWFNLYAVTAVTRSDTTGGDPPQATRYTYASPGWHYDNGTVSRSATVTWDQWRGYQTVTTQTGTAPDPVTQSTTTYLQGISQDGPPGDTGAAVTLTTSQGQVVTDSDQFGGMQLEQIVYDGAGAGQVVTDTINLPWSSAAVAVNTKLDQAAFMTGPSSALTYTPLAGGGSRESIQDYTFNSYGLITAASAIPDTSNSAEDTCATTTYATNASTGLVDLPATQSTYAGPCSASGEGTGALIGQTEDFYDGEGLGAAPTAGNLTKTGKATAAGYFDTTTATYDQYGRILTSTNPDGGVTTTAYTPAAGAEPTAVTVTDPMGLVTTTTYDPARDLALTVTDPDGDVTTNTYDALGRQSAQWTPGNPASDPATTSWAYTLSTTAPPVTTERDEEPGGNYLTTDTIDDSLGNTVEVQQQTAGGGTDITDTTYNSDGWKASDSGPYYITGAPSGTLVRAAPASVPDQIGYIYDGDGRLTRQISYTDGTETWETDTAYGGNETTITPPAGGTPQTAWTNGAGETIAIWQYHAGAPVSVTDPASDYDTTIYTFTPAQELATITDAAGNQWSYTYDMAGDQLTASDPDAGTTTTTYDPAQLVTSVTDARGKTSSYAYDADGRKTAEYDTTDGAAKTGSDELASWTYDTLAKGQLTSSTAYENGAQYTEEYTGYNANGQPSGAATIIPSTQGALAGTYTQDYTYTPDGQQASYTDAAAGGLPAETVTTGYNSAGQADSLTGASPYADSLSYTSLGQPLQYTLGTSSDPAWITDTYSPQTGSLTQQNTQTGTAQTSVDDLNYTYNNAGDVTTEADTPAGAPAAINVQCFGYDYLGRLVQAWAQNTTSCPSAPSSAAEGGAAPYWDTYTYNTIGNLTGITATTPAGAVTTTTDTYPPAGAAQPHAITGQSVTSPADTTTSSTYGYDADGDLTTVTGTSQDQALSWNDAGQLTQDAITPASGSAQNTRYTYDADGNLLLTADAGTTTLYLSDEELSLNTSTGTVTGTRYYTLGTTTIATRTSGTGVSYLAGDQQGTDSLAISASNLSLTRRYYDPYGNTIGTPAASFPSGQRGFTGGAYDTATGLTDLGAREYQPQTGSFISTDTVLKPYDPQDLNAYAYATDNPATFSDPTGASAAPAQNTYYIPGCNGPEGQASYTAAAETLGVTCADALEAQELQEALGSAPIGYVCAPGAASCGTVSYWLAGGGSPNYSYQYTWDLGSVAAAGGKTASQIMSEFEQNPQGPGNGKKGAFPFYESCPKIMKGEQCTLQVAGGPQWLTHAKGNVRMTIDSPTSFTITVDGTDYFDAPGSNITFTIAEAYGQVYLTQRGIAHGPDLGSQVSLLDGHVHATWEKMAGDLQSLLGLPRTWALPTPPRRCSPSGKCVVPNP